MWDLGVFYPGDLARYVSFLLILIAIAAFAEGLGLSHDASDPTAASRQLGVGAVRGMRRYRVCMVIVGVICLATGITLQFFWIEPATPYDLPLPRGEFV